MAANDQQMQVFADTRVRRRAEQFRNFLAALADDKASIDEVFTRATGNSRWDDARTDGPPTLLQSGNAASPDHMLAYNSLISQLLWLVNNVGEAPADTVEGYQAFVNALRGNWAVVIDACVRPIDE